MFEAVVLQETHNGITLHWRRRPGQSFDRPASGGAGGYRACFDFEAPFCSSAPVSATPVPPIPLMSIVFDRFALIRSLLEGSVIQYRARYGRTRK